LPKELTYRFKNNSEIESLLNRLEEETEVVEDSMDEGLGHSFRDKNHTFEMQILPLKKGEFYEIIIRTRNSLSEALIKKIFGQPIREAKKDASILDVAEYISDLPNNISSGELDQLIIEKFSLNKRKINLYKKLIIKQSTKETTRKELLIAAKRFQKENK
jgi:hypothetical protein